MSQPISKTQHQYNSQNSTPPQITAPADVHFPEFVEMTLANGMRVYILEDRTQTIATVTLVSKVGAANEHVYGLGGFTASLLKRGTESRTAQEIAETMDFMGGSLSAYCGWDTMTVSVNVLSSFLPVAVQVLSDVVKHPTFSSQEVERLRVQAIAGIKHNLSDPEYVASMTYINTQFPNHPYGHQISGTTESITAIKREDCQLFYKNALRPERCFIVVSGNVGVAEVEKYIAPEFGEWSVEYESTLPDIIPAPVPTHTKPLVIIVPKDDAVQTAFCIGHRSVTHHDSDFVPIQFLNTLFGGFFSSRLMKNLREEKGYTYGIYSAIEARKYGSSLVIGTSVGREVSKAALQEIVGEITRISQERISEEEFLLTRNYLLGSLALRFETSATISSMLSVIEAFNLPHDYFTQYTSTIRQMSVASLAAVAQRNFQPQKLVIVAVGDAAYLQKELAEFGDIILLDKMGNPKN